jgi:hypothetical protein
MCCTRTRNRKAPAAAEMPPRHVTVVAIDWRAWRLRSLPIAELVDHVAREAIAQMRRRGLVSLADLEARDECIRELARLMPAEDRLKLVNP